MTKFTLYVYEHVFKGGLTMNVLFYLKYKE